MNKLKLIFVRLSLFKQISSIPTRLSIWLGLGHSPNSLGEVDFLQYCHGLASLLFLVIAVENVALLYGQAALRTVSVPETWLWLSFPS